jgi:hypothetical protein
VVATDRFMSGWGGAEKGKSYYAIAIESWQGRSNADAENDAYIVMANLKHRKEMSRVRWVKFIDPSRRMIGNTRMGPHDHLSITDRAHAPRFFVKDSFKEAKKTVAKRSSSPKKRAAKKGFFARIFT